MMSTFTRLRPHISQACLINDRVRIASCRRLSKFVMVTNRRNSMQCAECSMLATAEAGVQ